MFHLCRVSGYKYLYTEQAKIILLTAILGLEITPYLPPGVTIQSTVTTTDHDFDNEKFKYYSDAPENDSEGNYDIR